MSYFSQHFYSRADTIEHDLKVRAHIQMRVEFYSKVFISFQSTILHAHTALAHASFADEAPYEWTGPCSSHIYYGKKGRREREREKKKEARMK